MKARALLLFVAVTMCFALVAADAHALANIIINNNDGPGEGFNDPTPVAPVGGNPGTTLGEQRLNAFTYAANIWAQCLTSGVTIVVNAQMNGQFCSGGSAVLGSAGTTTVHRDFAGAIQASTWYPQALANSLNGADLDPGNPDINATFNSNIGTSGSCALNWYYGYDMAAAGLNIDFITVVAHEIGHGLGFQTFQNSAGNWFLGFQDTYGTFMYHDGAVPPDYPSMSAAQRGTCNLGDPNLVFDGTCTNTEAAALPVTAGMTNGRMRLHGPNPYQSGSSLSHFSPAISPNEMMEPFYNAPLHDVGIGIYLLKDIGWTLDPKSPVSVAISSYEVVNTSKGVRVSAEFASGFDNLYVKVYRNIVGETARVIHSQGHRNGDPFAYVDESAVPGETYEYRIGVADEDGEFYSPFQKITLPGVEFALQQNHPNPFNPTTTIGYSLSAADEVRLVVYDARGALVKVLVDEAKTAGEYSAVWNGLDNNGNAVASGVYFYRLIVGQHITAKKRVMLK